MRSKDKPCINHLISFGRKETDNLSERLGWLGQNPKPNPRYMLADKKYTVLRCRKCGWWYGKKKGE